MKPSEVKFYSDPAGFMDGDATYPCNTQFMVYNPLLHRYYLTPEGLLHYGINAEQKYISDNPNKVAELIEKTSKKVYDYIQYKAGRESYQVQMYRIATAPPTIYPDQYFMRKQFESALADQARWIVETGDSARYSRINLENEEQPAIGKPSDIMRDISDMSKECIRTLETLGLTRWFKPVPGIRLDQNKY